MACLKRLLPAGYSGYSQIPAQSRSRSLPWWAKPLPAPGALLQTFINPFVLHVPGFEVGMCIFSIYIYIIFPFKPSHPLSAGCPPSVSLAERAARSQAGARAWLAFPAQWQRWSGSPLPPRLGTGLKLGQDLPRLPPTLSQAWAWLQRWRDLVCERPLPQSAFEWHS